MEVFDQRDSTPVSLADCAEQVIAVVPAVMAAFRAEMRAGRPVGISLPQFRALIRLQCRPGASMSEIADHLGVALSTTSQLIDALVRRGYAQCDTASGDHRRAAITLTPEGRAMLRTVRARAQARMEERLASLTAEERQAVGAAMEALAPLFRHGREREA
jgi:DNA-binding MarR family transcriptional regulator